MKKQGGEEEDCLLILIRLLGDCSLCCHVTPHTLSYYAPSGTGFPRESCFHISLNRETHSYLRLQISLVLSHSLYLSLSLTIIKIKLQGWQQNIWYLNWENSLKNLFKMFFSQYSQSHVKCILVGNSFTISRLRSGCRGGCHVWPTIIISGVSPKKYFQYLVSGNILSKSLVGGPFWSSWLPPSRLQH